MQPFSTHVGVAVPLRRSNVDTDQIIPAVYLKRLTRTGFEDGLFSAWRNDPNFVLNQPAYQGASILVPGPDFGTGSSREHAVWALQNYGFRVIIGSRFGDIFRNNAGKAGLLVALIEQAEVDQLWAHIEAAPGLKLEVDLQARTITDHAGFDLNFAIDDHTQWRLLQGLDDIGLTMREAARIDAFEAARPDFLPTTLPARTAS